MRLSENVHLPFDKLTVLSKVEGLRYPHPSSLRRTFMYASFLGISEALHMDIFHQPLRSWFFHSFYPRPQSAFENAQRASKHQVIKKDGGIP